MHQHTAVAPLRTASNAYSTWNKCPSGENTVIALSYREDMLQWCEIAVLSLCYVTTGFVGALACRVAGLLTLGAKTEKLRVIVETENFIAEITMLCPLFWCILIIKWILINYLYIIWMTVWFLFSKKTRNCEMGAGFEIRILAGGGAQRSRTWEAKREDRGDWLRMSGWDEGGVFVHNPNGDAVDDDTSENANPTVATPKFLKFIRNFLDGNAYIYRYFFFPFLNTSSNYISPPSTSFSPYLSSTLLDTFLS